MRMTPEPSGSIVSQPLLSVIVTSYKVGELLLEAVDSVTQQLARDLPRNEWEVIVVDDASGDPSSEACLRTLHERDASMRIIRQPRNQGVSAARNTGAAAATGEWLAFLDGDDCWVPGRVGILRTALARHPDATWISADFRRITMDGSEFGAACIRHPSIVSSLDSDGGECTRLGQPVDAAVTGFLCHANSTLIRRQVFIGTGGFDESLRSAEDHDLWIRLAARHDLVYVARSASLYRSNPNSITNTTRKPHPHLGIVYRKALADPLARRHAGLIKRRLEKIALENLLHLRHRRQYGETMREAIAALKTSPGFLAGWKHFLAALLRID
ncbi:glycosyltransferase family 2 protein [Uliginosibacterium sp. H1]|uniref:glycosyltransferase family 2 protein n=1 Tax=Uliginosibacterium sp. H1 TaxID=3114757 RepID=UPI002E17AD7A|nr:glycosyltransferase [Uliginosibacterium sp. H1]